MGVRDKPCHMGLARVVSQSDPAPPHERSSECVHYCVSRREQCLLTAADSLPLTERASTGQHALLTVLAP